MYARILTYPKDRSFFLFGPRSTGKSTWVQEAFPPGLFVDLLKASTFPKLTAQPDRLGGNLSLFNPCLDSVRKEFSCRHGFTSLSTSVCSREPKPS